MTSAQLELQWSRAEGTRRKRQGQARAASRHEPLIAQLVPVAIELARQAGRTGIIAGDVRIEGVRRGILTGRETGRELSFLCVVMRRAGLVRTTERRSTRIVQSHANSHVVYLAPEFAGRAA